MSIHHANALALAQVTARPSPARLQAVLALERVIGREIPGALRELATSDIWPEFLSRFSNCDEPLDMGSRWSKWPGYDPIADDLLPFMVENQGVCTWAVVMNGSDDPPVVVEVDSTIQPQWMPCAAAFSEWVHCQVEDRLLLDRALFAAQLAPLAEADLAELRASFSEGTHTFGWPAKDVLRLAGPDGSLLLWAGADQCDWWIAPNDLVVARALLESIPWPGSSEGFIYELKSEGRAILDEWRSSRDHRNSSR